MAKQTINIGASPNDGTGTPLRTAFDYTNQNFTELYTATGPSGNNIVVPGSATITGDLTVRTNKLAVTSTGVGIGTATPALPLDVAGGMQVTSGSAGGLYQWAYGASASSRSWRAWNDVSANGDFQISTSTTRTGSTYSDRYRIDVTGVHEWSNTSGLAMTLNSTGLGVGKVPASNQSKVQISQALGTSLNGALHITDDATTSFVFNNTSSGVSSIWTSGALTFSTGSNAYSTNGARMTLDASGNLFISKTATGLGTVGIQASPSGWLQATVSGDASLFTNRLASDGKTVQLYRQTLEVGNISVTTTGATFNSTSDYRLKEAVAPLSGGLARVNALKPSVYKWKSNGLSGEGFLAHELADVVPAAVNGEKDAVNEDGSINAQSIDMSRVVPILVAAIQELTARVQTLETR